MIKIFDWEFLLRDKTVFIGKLNNHLECIEALRRSVNALNISIRLCINADNGIFYLKVFSDTLADDIQKYIAIHSIQEIEEA